jgi:hypothetical protein
MSHRIWWLIAVFAVAVGLAVERESAVESPAPPQAPSASQAQPIVAQQASAGRS